MCLRNIFFFILIFVFGCRESAEKVPKNTFPTVILLRVKWNFSSFNPRLLVNSSHQYLTTVHQQSFCLKYCSIAREGFFQMSIYNFVFAPLLEMLLEAQITKFEEEKYVSASRLS